AMYGLGFLAAVVEAAAPVPGPARSAAGDQGRSCDNNGTGEPKAAHMDLWGVDLCGGRSAMNVASATAEAGRLPEAGSDSRLPLAHRSRDHRAAVATGCNASAQRHFYRNRQ